MQLSDISNYSKHLAPQSFTNTSNCSAVTIGRWQRKRNIAEMYRQQCPDNYYKIFLFTCPFVAGISWTWLSLNSKNEIPPTFLTLLLSLIVNTSAKAEVMLSRQFICHSACTITTTVISWFYWNLVLWLDLIIWRSD